MDRVNHQYIESKKFYLIIFNINNPGTFETSYKQANNHQIEIRDEWEPSFEGYPLVSPTVEILCAPLQ